MSEPEKPKRRFWQIHLSTAVAMSLLAGGLLWANLTYSIMRSNNDSIRCLGMGWPWPMIVFVEARYDGKWHSFSAHDDEVSGFATNLRPVSIQYIVADCIAFVFGILSLALSCEYLIRQREHRK